MSSRQAVNCIQRLLPGKRARLGHAGTLDPLATGVLVVGVGRATRLIPHVQQMRKFYRATFQLGCESPTEDTEGNVVRRSGDPQPSREMIAERIPEFLGEIMQRPPAYSALKVGGRRAYAMARSGETVDLAARPVTIYALRIVEYAYPELVLDIACGSGTYVRSLGRDLARRLETAAVMSGLVRTAIGRFRIEDSVLPTELTRDTLEEHLQPPCHAITELESAVLEPEEIRRIAQGLSISDRFDFSSDVTEWAGLDADGRLVAIMVGGRGNDRLGWGPARNFADLL